MWISSTELVTYLREQVTTADQASIDQIVDLTNALVDAVAGLQRESVDPPGVTPIRLEVAARAYRNPNGYGERYEEYTGPKLPGGRSGVYLSDDERAELLGRPAASTPTAWAGSMSYSFRG